MDTGRFQCSLMGCTLFGLKIIKTMQVLNVGFPGILWKFGIIYTQYCKLLFSFERITAFKNGLLVPSIGGLWEQQMFP